MTIRTYYTPTAKERPGCSCCMTPYLQTTLEDGHVEQSTRMRLVFETRGTIYNFELGPTHQELEQTSRQLNGSGSSNILLAKVGFFCAISLKSGERIYKYVIFDLRIPGTGGQGAVFSYEHVAEKYGGKEPLYEKISHLYAEGRQIANPMDRQHGHNPKYSSGDSKQDQYIRHTEQLLSAQLALPETAQMLRNRLDATIRGNYPSANRVRVYTMGLHLHSTKTCCAPCEYTLLGLMRGEGPEGLLTQFQQIRAKETLGFTFPRGNMHCLITVGANETDADHKALPTFTWSRHVNRYFDIRAMGPQTQIFTTLFRIPITQIPRLIGMDLTDKTVSISGSKKTSGSPDTMKKVEEIRKEENSYQKLRHRLFS